MFCTVIYVFTKVLALAFIYTEKGIFQCKKNYTVANLDDSVGTSTNPEIFRL